MRVVNKYKEKYSVYIGRGSVFGNPFPIGEFLSREEAIAKFEVYLRNNDTLLEQVRQLPESAVLGCFCKPKPCHGDVIVKVWQEMNLPVV